MENKNEFIRLMHLEASRAMAEIGGWLSPGDTLATVFHRVKWNAVADRLQTIVEMADLVTDTGDFVTEIRSMINNCAIMRIEAAASISRLETLWHECHAAPFMSKIIELNVQIAENEGRELAGDTAIRILRELQKGDAANETN